MSIGNRLKAIRAHLGLTQGEAARFFGFASWQRLELEDRAPKGPVLEKLANLGFSLDWLVAGEGEMRREDQAIQARLAEIGSLLADEQVPFPAAALPERPHLARIRGELEAADIEATFVSVPVYDIRVGAGGWTLVEQEEIETEIAFRAGWLRRLGVPRERLAVVRIAGNSMEPTIRAGDAALLEREPERLIQGEVYVLGRADELKLCRPQRRAGGSLLLHSDNPAWDDVTLGPEEAAGIRVLGRVRWLARTL